MLLGREQETAEIERTLDRARSGVSTTLALVGEPGIGKTALLDHAQKRAAGMRVLCARGIESEAQIPFGSLLEVLRPALGVLEQIPRPQAIALEEAFALRPGHAQERFAVGAATLSVLAAYAEEAPLLILLDDVQWFDRSSAQALLFAMRRLVADPIAALLAVREGEPSLLDGTDLPSMRIAGLSGADVARLLGDVPPMAAQRLHRATAGNPLALLELAPDSSELALAPDGAPLLVPARVAGAFMQRSGTLSETARRVLLLAAASDGGDLQILAGAAAHLGVDVSELAAAEAAGLVSMHPGRIEFRHPLVRSAIYADASFDARRDVHRALAAALPDRDVDRRAWHLAAAALGTDEAASAALDQAGTRSRDRSAYSTAAAAFERGAQLTSDRERQSRLLLEAANAAWAAGLADHTSRLLDESRAATDDPARLVEIDWLAGYTATRVGPVMDGYSILTGAASRADPELAVRMYAEAVMASFVAGRIPEAMFAAAAAQAALPPDAAPALRFMAATATGVARILGGDAAAGADSIHGAIAIADEFEGLRDDLQLLPWFVVATMFLRESETGRRLLDQAVEIARERAAVGALPVVLGLIARDQATTDRWALAEATYREAIELARESDQRVGLAALLAGLSWLHAHRGRATECRACATEALALSREVGTRFYEVWAITAFGELELGLGDAGLAVEHLEHQRRIAGELSITDVDLWPGAELVDAYLRLGRVEDARRVTGEFRAAAQAKGQPWSLARALRCEGLVAEADFAAHFEVALEYHAQTPDAFQEARTRLAYGERLRRGRNRVLAREQLRAAEGIFDRLGAQPWGERARAELAATGETLRRGDMSAADALTPQELQIATLLAGGRTTREAAAALFLSPKTVEYHLRHVYMKLDIHSREELAGKLASRPADTLPQ